MTAALRALPGERREIALRPWLFRVAHNESISIARARREATTTHEPASRRRLGPISTRSTASASDSWSPTSSTLPERQRAALVMRELSGLSYDEIGSALWGHPRRRPTGSSTRRGKPCVRPPLRATRTAPRSAS